MWDWPSFVVVGVRPVSALKCKCATANLGWAKSLFHILKNIKEQVSFQTIVVGNLMLVLTNGNKTFIIDWVL